MKSVRHLGMAAAAVAGLTTALPSPAQQQQRTMPTAPAWYFGAGVGVSWPQFTNSDWNNVASGLNSVGLNGGGPPLTQSTTKDNTAVGWKVFGGYRVNPYFGVEASYAGLGSFDYNYTFAQGGVQTGTSDMSYKVYSVNVAVVPRLPLEQGLYVQGKVGAAFTRAENNFNLTLPTITEQASQSKSKTNLLAGAGIGYDFANGLGVIAEYEYYGKVGNSFTYSATGGIEGTGRADMNLFTVSGMIRF